MSLVILEFFISQPPL